MEFYADIAITLYLNDLNAIYITKYDLVITYAEYNSNLYEHYFVVTLYNFLKHFLPQQQMVFPQRFS